MLSTILEVSCEEPISMWSFIDNTHYQHVQDSWRSMNDQEKEDKNCQTIDDTPVLTAFSKNESTTKNFLKK